MDLPEHIQVPVYKIWQRTSWHGMISDAASLNTTDKVSPVLAALQATFPY